MHFKNNNGFTLIETLLTVAIMGMLLTPLFISQGTILFSVRTLSDEYARISAAKNFLIASRLSSSEDKKVAPKSDEELKATLKYSLEKLSGDLEKKFNGLKREKVVIEWQDGINRRQEALVSFVFKPEKEEQPL